MNEFPRTVSCLALSFGMALAFAASGAEQETQGTVTQGQSLSEQQRLPAAKEGSSNAGQRPGATSPDSSKKTTEASPVDKTQADQKKTKKHPPTAVMDRATPPEKSPTDKESTAKHPPTTAMERATPDQKSTEPSGASDAKQNP